MTKTMRRVEDTKAYKGRVLWLFTKYQLLSKTILALLMYPIYHTLVQFLLNSSGRTVFSSGDFISFLLSFNGIGLLLITLVMMVIFIGLDVNSFILMSALIKEGRIEVTARQMIWVSLQSLKHFLSPAGLLMMVYISLIFPLIGLGITISPMKDFQIPNFITSVIYANPLYLTLYSLVLIFLTYLSYRFIFTFHYMLIMGKPTKESFKSSAQLTKKYGFSFLKSLLKKSLMKGFMVILPLAMLFIILLGLTFWLVNADNVESTRFLLFFLLLALSEVVAVFMFLLIPLFILSITELFYDYNEKEGKTISLVFPIKASRWAPDIEHKIRLRTKSFLAVFVLVLVGMNALLSAIFTLHFESLFKTNTQMAVIAHRAGGDLGAENTIEGILEAIKEKIDWTEIDIQRTKDGAYVLNHDGDFKRVAGNPRTSNQLTLAEVKKMRVKNSFDPSKPSQPIPTIEEVVEVSKGKIGLFIELKGQTADEKMADDMVKLIKNQRIEQEAVLLSLDYNLITYIKQTYPEIQTGYLYYFAVGETKDLLGDYLIMEEREATPEKVAELKSYGKKVIVWTVNTDESVDRFTASEVDGIITDYVRKVKQGIKDQDNRSDIDIIIDAIFGT